MIEDLRRTPDGHRFAADVCIVGAGPAGVALARSLAGSGLEVLLLESGGLRIESASQALNMAENVGLPHGGALDGRARTFGGAGRLWAGQCLRLDPIDFAHRPWVPGSGWPVGAAELAPYYDEAERFFRVEGQPTDSRAYALFKHETPDWAAGTVESMFTVYTPEVDVGRFHKQALRQADKVTVLLHANVVHVDTDGARATGVRLRTLEGKTAQVQARAVVLCAGGVENARLLLASDGQRPGGLGNGRDLVGRYFQEHPNGITATVTDADPVALQARFRMLYGTHRFFPKFRLTEAAQREGGLLNANAHLVFEEAGDSGMAALRSFIVAGRKRRLPERPVRQALALVRGAGAIGRAALARARGGAVSGRTSAIRLQCYLEQSPNPDSRVRLGRDRDALGMRRAAIDWHLTELERRTATRLTEIVAGEFGRLGLGRVEPDPWLGEPGDAWQNRLVDCYHHAGTTRMATDASSGVVSPSLEVFDTPGLYVCGGSAFPTSGYANPTLTIVALACRLAGHLRKDLAA